MRRCFGFGDLVPLSAILPRTSSRPRAIPYDYLGFPPDAPGWQFYHPTSRCVLPSRDMTLDEVLLPQGFCVEGYVSRGAEPASSEPRGAEPASVEPGVLSLRVRSLGVLSLRVRSLGVLSLRVQSVGLGGAESKGAKSRGAEPRGTVSAGGPVGASP
ncbi:unnamed protein product [Closterium sp. NIES-54]